MTGFSSVCDRPLLACNPYAHKHCANCNATLNAVGGGGDDGLSIGGYEDAHGNGAKSCATCSDSLLCRFCAGQSDVCPHCKHECSNCEECRTGGAA